MKIPPAKRNQLIGVLIGTAGLIGLVFFLLIRPQNEKNGSLGKKIVEENQKLSQYKDVINQKEAKASKLAEVSEQLNKEEEDVASGDLYAWSVDTIRRFKAGYRVDIPTIGEPTVGECDLFGSFPYRQLRFSLNGSAYYHDLGKFVADFENRFPHFRVVNLVIDADGPGGGGGEKLNFRMEIAALVKPAN